MTLPSLNIYIKEADILEINPLYYYTQTSRIVTKTAKIAIRTARLLQGLPVLLLRLKGLMHGLQWLTDPV